MILNRFLLDNIFVVFFWYIFGIFLVYTETHANNIQNICNACNKKADSKKPKLSNPLWAAAGARNDRLPSWASFRQLLCMYLYVYIYIYIWIFLVYIHLHIYTCVTDLFLCFANVLYALVMFFLYVLGFVDCCFHERCRSKSFRYRSSSTLSSCSYFCDFHIIS